MLWFTGGDCDTVIYSTDLFKGVGFLMLCFWLTSFLLSHIGHVLGWERSGTWASDGFNWPCFTISLSQPYAQYRRGSAGRRASWLSNSRSSWHVNNVGHRALLRRRLFVTGSDCFGNSFRLEFQFLADRQYYVSMYWNVHLLKWMCWNKALFSSTFL